MCIYVRVYMYRRLYVVKWKETKWNLKEIRKRMLSHEICIASIGRFVQALFGWGGWVKLEVWDDGEIEGIGKIHIF